jgi:hypothetical protein
MKSDLVVREQRPYELTDKQVAIIANTEFVPKDKRGKHDVIWASIFKGRSIGIDDFTAIHEIHIVNGKPGLSAALAAGIARGARPPDRRQDEFHEGDSARDAAPTTARDDRDVHDRGREGRWARRQACVEAISAVDVCGPAR